MPTKTQQSAKLTSQGVRDLNDRQPNGRKKSLPEDGPPCAHDWMHDYMCACEDPYGPAHVVSHLLICRRCGLNREGRL